MTIAFTHNHVVYTIAFNYNLVVTASQSSLPLINYGTYCKYREIKVVYKQIFYTMYIYVSQNFYV